MCKVYIKKYKEKNSLIAICDKNLLNKTFHEGRLKLEVKEDFYGNELCTVEEAIVLLDKAELANLVGERIIDAAIRNNLVDPQAVIHIDGIPHVQIMKFNF
jgi:hypothetical protein